MSTPDALSEGLRPRSNARLWWEIGIVLALSVGRSALYSVLQLVRALQREQALGDQQTSLNPGASAAEFWDVLYQFLAHLLLARAGRPRDLPAVGARRRRRCGASGWTSAASAATSVAASLLVAVIGIPGLGLYALGRALGITVQVDAAPLDPVVVDDPPPAARRAARRPHRGGHLHRLPVRPAAPARVGLVDDHPLDRRAARGVPRLPGLRSDDRQLRDGRRLRLVLPPLGPRHAPRHRPHAHRHHRVRRLPDRGRPLARRLRTRADARRRRRPRRRSGVPRSAYGARHPPQRLRRTPRSAGTRTRGCGRRTPGRCGARAASTSCARACGRGTRPSRASTGASTRPR